MGRTILFQSLGAAAAQDGSSGIDLFRDSMAHEKFHAVNQAIRYTNDAFASGVDISTSCSGGTWAFNLDRGDTSPDGRTFNHDTDLNGDGDSNDTVKEKNIVAAAGGAHDVNGDGDQEDMINEKMDDDEDDLPHWDDYNGDGTSGTIERDGDAAEPRDEDAYADKDWGNPGKQHNTDNDHLD